MVIRITMITSLLEEKLREEDFEHKNELNRNYLNKISIIWSEFNNLQKVIDQINTVMIIFT